jgi:hypothetical protein
LSTELANFDENERNFCGDLAQKWDNIWIENSKKNGYT